MSNYKNRFLGILSCVSSNLFLIALVLLIVFSCIYGNTVDVVLLTLLGSFTFLYYLFNTLLYWIPNQKASTVFIKLINILFILVSASINILVCINILKGPLGWTFFGIECGIALLGTIFCAIWINIPTVVMSPIFFTMYIPIVFTIYKLINYNNSIKVGLFFLIISLIFYLIKIILVNFMKFSKIIAYLTFIFFFLYNLCIFSFIFDYLIYL